MRWIASLLLLALTLAVPAAAQELDAEHVKRAREAALKFLTEGPDAPRPHVTRAQVEAAPMRRGSFPGRGPLARLCVAGCYLGIGRSGYVHEFEDPDARMRVATTFEGRSRTEADIAAETSARCLFTPAQLEARGREFLARRIERFAERNFVVNLSALQVFHGLAYHDLFVSEDPRPGQLAVATNVNRVFLSPETGKVEFYSGEGYQFEVTAPPPLDAAAAARRVTEKVGATELGSVCLRVVLRGGALRPAWAVWAKDSTWYLWVDATDGTVFERED